MAKKITKWEPDNFELEMTTHWSFPQRGDWATHDAKWRGIFLAIFYFAIRKRAILYLTSLQVGERHLWKQSS